MERESAVVAGLTRRSVKAVADAVKFIFFSAFFLLYKYIIKNYQCVPLTQRAPINAPKEPKTPISLQSNLQL